MQYPDVEKLIITHAQNVGIKSEEIKMTKKPFDWVAFWKDVNERKLELDRQAREDYINYVEDDEFEEV